MIERTEMAWISKCGWLSDDNFAYIIDDTISSSVPLIISTSRYPTLHSILFQFPSGRIRSFMIILTSYLSLCVPSIRIILPVVCYLPQLCSDLKEHIVATYYYISSGYSMTVFFSYRRLSHRIQWGVECCRTSNELLYSCYNTCSMLC